MNADDLQSLYKLLRGSKSGPMVLDARGLFIDRQYIKTQALLVEAREKFAESRTRLLKQDPEKLAGDKKGKEAEQELRRLKRKQNKARETLEKFDELAPQIDRLARREQKVLDDAAPAANEELMVEPELGPAEQIETPDSDPTETVAYSNSLTDEFADAFRETSGDGQLDVIGRHFGFREVKSIEDIHSDAIYFIRSGDKSYLIRTLPDAPLGDDVGVEGALDGRSMKPISQRKFLELGQRRKMVLLTVAAV